MSNLPISHPCDPTRVLEIVPDVVHVFKSMIHGWINNKTIQLPEEVIQQNGLSSSIVDVKHLTDLVRYEEKCDLKMTCGLTIEDVDFSKPISNFDKMRVKNALKFVNHTVVSAMRFYSAVSGRKDILTTAFFLEMVSNWYTYMTPRSPEMAVSLTNEKAYEKAITALNEFRKLVYGCQVGVKKIWKPWQASAILTTDSFLRLQQYFLRDQKFDFFCGGRLTQDCMENVFTQLRQRQARPTALQAKDNLKLLSLSQYMNEVHNSSYDWDPGNWLTGITDHLSATTKGDQKNQSEFAKPIDPPMESTTEATSMDDYAENAKPIDPSMESTTEAAAMEDYADGLVEECENLCTTASEQNVVYYLAGRIVKQLSVRTTVCQVCIKSCTTDEQLIEDYALYTKIKDYTGSALTNVNSNTYNFFLELEEIFKKNIGNMMLINDNLENRLISIMSTIPAPHIPCCHAMREKLIKRYVQFRLKVNRTKIAREKRYDSRSMAV